MDEALENFNKLLPGLKKRYAEILREKIPALQKFLSQFKTGKCPEPNVRELALIIHGMKGSGATFGAPLITDIAGELELVLPDPGIPPEKQSGLTGKRQMEIAPLLERFLAACEAAL